MANSRNVSYTPNLSGEKHTTSAFADQNLFTGYSPMQKKQFFFKIIFPIKIER